MFFGSYLPVCICVNYLILSLCHLSVLELGVVHPMLPIYYGDETHDQCVMCTMLSQPSKRLIFLFLLEGLKLGCNLAALVPCLPRCTWIMLTVWDKNRWAFPFLSPSLAACKQIPSCLYIVIRNKCATKQMTVGHPINWYDHSIAASVVKILGGNE